MNLSLRFARLPRPVARRLIPVLRYLNLMRALELRLMAPWVQHVEGYRVLDAGCGHGLYSLDLARRGAMLVGCDLDSPALADARQTAQHLGFDGQAHFFVADGAALPLADGQFDLVVCNCVLEHIADDRAALADMARSLRAGGLLYLSVDNADHGPALGFLERLPPGIRQRLLRAAVLAAPSLSAGLDAHLDQVYAVRRRYRRADLVTILSSQGLTILDCRPYLTGVGAAQFEAFHALRGLDPAKGLGRVAYMLSSLLLYPLASWSDSRRRGQGRGLALVACKEGEARP
jgi:SAM-dependent methyltransferase